MDLGLSPGLPLSVTLCDGTLRLLRTRMASQKAAIQQLIAENQPLLDQYDAELRRLEASLPQPHQQDPDVAACLRMLELNAKEEKTSQDDSWNTIRMIALRRDYERKIQDGWVISRKTADLSLLPEVSQSQVEFYLWLVEEVFREQLAGLPHLAALFHNDCRWLEDRYGLPCAGLGEAILETIVSQFEREMRTLSAPQGRLKLTQLERVWRDILDPALLSNLLSRLSEALCEAAYRGGHKDFDWQTLPDCAHRKKLIWRRDLMHSTPLCLINVYRHGEVEGIFTDEEFIQVVCSVMPDGALRQAFLREIRQ